MLSFSLSFPSFFLSELTLVSILPFLSRFLSTGGSRADSSSSLHEEEDDDRDEDHDDGQSDEDENEENDDDDDEQLIDVSSASSFPSRLIHASPQHPPTL